MKFDFEAAFTYFTKDEQWLKKVLIVASYYLIGCLCFLAPIVLIIFGVHHINPKVLVILSLMLWIVSAIFLCVPNGFCFQVGNERLNGDITKLPELGDFFKQAFIGFKYSIGCMLLFLPLLIFYAFVYANYPEYFNSSNSTDYSLKEFLVDITGNVFNFLLSILVPSYLSMFLRKLNPFEFLNLKNLFTNIKNNPLPYLIFVGLFFAINMLVSISFIFIIFIIGIVLVPVLDVLVTLIYTEMAVQYEKICAQPKVEVMINESENEVNQ